MISSNEPSISIVTCLYNSDREIFKKTLEAIKHQKYPKAKIEHIVMDGGSNNHLLSLAREYNCKVFTDKKLKNFPARRMSIGISKAKGDLVLILEPDNILVSPTWFADMVKPFAEDKEIFCAYSMHNTFEKGMNLLTKYAALFGTGDPMLYYLGKSEKARMDEEKYSKGKILHSKNRYFKVKFDRQDLPTLGDNGHMVRRNVISKVNRNASEFVHVDAFMQLHDMGYDKFGVVKNSIIHVQLGSIKSAIVQRIKIKRKFYDAKRGKRKYLVFSWSSRSDLFNLIKFGFFSLTLIEPLFESARGYVRVRDRAWFLHPIMCLVMFLAYAYSEISFLKIR